MIPTPEQQKAIETTDRTVLLSAAAGSGKTATLTERLITMITRREDPLDVSRMLIVTFTRAAAEELRVRISDALAEAVAKDPSNAWLARQTLLLPTARIRTIDGFCNDIVKGHTEDLGISPLYRIANESESKLLGNRLMSEVVDDAYSGTFAPEGLELLSLVESVESVKENGTLSELLYELYTKKLCQLPEGLFSLKANIDTLLEEAKHPFFESRVGKVFFSHYAALFAHKEASLRTVFDDAIARFGASSPLVCAIRNKTLALLDFFERMTVAANTSYEAVKAELAAYAATRIGAFPKGYKPTEEEEHIVSTVQEFGSWVTAFKASEPFAWEEKDISYAFVASSRICRSVYLLLSEFEKRFLEEKTRLSLCDYADIERYAYRLLWEENGERSALALALSTTFDTICIDEYQDVNELQHKIFEAIATKRNRFMVGDIKQSIYGFRGAEPDIFARLRSSYPPITDKDASEAVLFLTQNFRSERSVIALANGVFDFLFPIIGDAIGYVEEDRLRTEKEPADIPRPVFYLVQKPEKDELAEGEVPKSENDLIAEKVLALLHHGTLKNGKRIRPSDIAVLSRGGHRLEELILILRAYGIPIRTEDKGSFFLRPEILLARALCHTVNNPHNDLYLCATLRSPLYGFTMDELITIRDASPEGASLFDGLCAFLSAHPAFEKGAHFLSDCDRFRALAENTPAHRLIRTLFEETGIYAVTDGDGRANLRVFYELARTYEEGAFRGLYRFLDRLSEMEEFGAGLDKRAVGAEEAVTVSTIHASKGLEYPVCILAHTGSSLGGGGAPPAFRFSPALGLFSNIEDSSGIGTLKTPLYKAAALAEERRETEEAVRTLYVALTRPKEQLYMFCAPQRKLLSTVRREAALLRTDPSCAALIESGSFAAWMLAALEDKETLCEIRTLRYPYISDEPLPAPAENGEPTPAPSKTEASDAAAQKDEFLSLYRDRFSFRYPYEAQTLLPAKLSVSALYPGALDEIAARSPFDREITPNMLFSETEKSEQAPDENTFTPTVPAFLSGKEENEAALAGTATHLFLQFCDFDRVLQRDSCQIEDALEEELARLLAGGFLLASDAARVRKKELIAFLSSPLAARLADAKKLYREFRFHAHLPAELFSEEKDGKYDGLSVFVQGVVDLIIENEDGSLLLVDYKTDRIPRAALGNTDKESAFLWARHGMQLSLYGRAVERIFGESPTLAIYSLHAGKLLFAPK